MLSVLTNNAAAQAVRALNDATAELALRQQRVATGRAVNGTKDDSATYTIAQSLRSDAGARRAIGQNMARANSVLDVTTSGTERISDLVNQIKAKAYGFSDAADSASRDAIKQDIQALVSQIDTIAKSADFNGTNLLAGRQLPLVQSTRSTAMSASFYPLPDLPTMAALPLGSTLRNTSVTTVGLAASPLTPASFATALASLGGQGAQTASMNGGATAGRVALLVDAYSVPDTVEVWQHGVRRAATGQAYVAGGGAVAPGSPMSGKTLLAFDYDPANGQDLEIRVNPGGATPGTSWAIDALQLQDSSTPPTTATSYAASSELIAKGAATPMPASVDPEQAALQLGNAPENARASYVANLGAQAGRVDLAFDAFGTPDVMEVWQNGARIAATGQSYTAGGGAVPAGTAVSGQQVMSFDYDPSSGAVTFTFNPDGAPANSAWAVTGLALNRPTDPVATASTTINSVQQVGTIPINYDIMIGLDQTTLRVGSRDLTAAGLGLNALDWSEPGRIVDAAVAATAQVNEALGYFGSRARAIDAAASFNSRIIDVLDGATGDLVDADLAKESAKLQAAQIRQQLAAKALSIANEQPKIILSLFDKAA